jgi:predicted ATPase
MADKSPISKRPSMRLRLENFRLFKDSGWFKLAPLTCLVGRNSSGKSSVLSAILLLKQSLERGAMGSALMPLTLSGPYCDLGNYIDLVHNHKESSEITLSLSMDMSDLAGAALVYPVPLVQLAVPRSPASDRLYYKQWLARRLPKKGDIEAHLTFSADEPFGPSLNRFELTVENIGNVTFLRTTSGERRPHWRVYTRTLPPRALSLAQRSYSYAYFPEVIIRSKSYRRSAPKARHGVRTFANAGELFFSYVAGALSRSDVIGPFRTPPERRYPFGGFSASRGGPTGEQAVNLLITEALLNPQSPRPLNRALSFWINHLKLAESLDVKDIAKRLNLFEVGVAGAGRGTKANLADVGFGVSQVLPVLVQGLLMRRGGIYLVQQPEIHLHPDAQAGLADFFIYLASHDVTTIVETHSEYLLLRLRRRLAEGIKPISVGLPMERERVSRLTKDDVAILFTGLEKKNASVRQLEIGDSFQFENLPTGFMSQALEDRVALLNAVGKRNA